MANSFNIHTQGGMFLRRQLFVIANIGVLCGIHTEMEATLCVGTLKREEHSPLITLQLWGIFKSKLCCCKTHKFAKLPQGKKFK